MSLKEARVLINAWRKDYNEHRPHSALNYQTPAEFAAAFRSKQTGSVLQEKKDV
ncbi:hypothetical protein FV185_09510 [Ferrovum sp. PN-J185]|nr:hypothetical protein FV185_09510 [Ferrovum sp. PN-J185]